MTAILRFEIFSWKGFVCKNLQLQLLNTLGKNNRRPFS